MRAVLAAVAFLFVAACAELSISGDGSSISVGKPNNGRLVNGVRLPDRGEGFTTSQLWIERGNRFGTDELIDLVVGVGRRMRVHVSDTRLVVADLSGPRGGAERAFHRSHQSGRDVDFVFYLRDAGGKPVEADTMRPFDAQGVAHDGSGLTIDVPRTWLLVKELLDAPEAVVQYIFIYEPIAKLLIDHAKERGESEELVARARKALRQPGDSARHDDHMHVRVYCAPNDRALGCIDIGPMDLLAEREATLAREPANELHAATTPPRDDAAAGGAAPGGVGANAAPTTLAPLLLRARPDRMNLLRGP